jgi:hypothetical protein
MIVYANDIKTLGPCEANIIAFKSEIAKELCGLARNIAKAVVILRGLRRGSLVSGPPGAQATCLVTPWSPTQLTS